MSCFIYIYIYQKKKKNRILFLSAPRSHTLQSRFVDIHSDPCADQTLHVSGNRVSVGYANLFERTARVYRTANGAHAQILLLGGEPEKQERHHTQRTG